jgi:flagellar assembly protein FliH
MSSSSRPRFRGVLGGGAALAVAAWDPAELRPREAAQATVSIEDAEHAAAEEQRALESAIQDAYERGLEDGRNEGAAAERNRLDRAVGAVEAAGAAFRERQPVWLEAIHKNMVALAVGVARAVIGRELKGQPEDVASLVQRAVTEFPLAVPLRIRLNPADLSAISSPLSGEGVTAGREVRWVPDPSIAPGGCFVEGPESLVDGRVDKALENIYDKLVYG